MMMMMNNSVLGASVATQDDDDDNDHEEKHTTDWKEEADLVHDHGIRSSKHHRLRNNHHTSSLSSSSVSSMVTPPLDSELRFDPGHPVLPPGATATAKTLVRARGTATSPPAATTPDGLSRVLPHSSSWRQQQALQMPKRSQSSGTSSTNVNSHLGESASLSERDLPSLQHGVAVNVADDAGESLTLSKVSSRKAYLVGSTSSSPVSSEAPPVLPQRQASKEGLRFFHNESFDVKDNGGGGDGHTGGEKDTSDTTCKETPRASNRASIASSPDHCTMSQDFLTSPPIMQRSHRDELNPGHDHRSALAPTKVVPPIEWSSLHTAATLLSTPMSTPNLPTRKAPGVDSRTPHSL